MLADDSPMAEDHTRVLVARPSDDKSQRYFSSTTQMQATALAVTDEGSHCSARADPSDSGTSMLTARRDPADRFKRDVPALGESPWFVCACACVRARANAFCTQIGIPPDPPPAFGGRKVQTEGPTWEFNPESAALGVARCPSGALSGALIRDSSGTVWSRDLQASRGQWPPPAARERRANPS